MLSVAESASLLGVSPSRVRALIAEGALPAEKIGRSWVLREEDVLQRAANRPGPGRPATIATCAGKFEHPEPSLPTSEIDLHDLYLACKKAFSVRPDAEAIARAESTDESSFYFAVADHFLQQRQCELVRQGAY